MTGIAGANKDAVIPVAGYLNGDMRGSAKAIETQIHAGTIGSILCTGCAKATEADDAGAKEGGGMQFTEASGEDVDEPGGSDNELGKAAIGGIAGEFGIRAEILMVVEATGATAASVVKPRNSDLSAGMQVSDILATAFDDSSDLVAGNDGEAAGGEFPFDNVKVGSADTAVIDVDEDIVRPGFGDGDVGEDERGGFDGSRLGEKHGSHGDIRNAHRGPNRREGPDTIQGEKKLDFAAGGSLVGREAVLGEVLKVDFDVAVPGTGAVVARAEVERLKTKLDALMARATALVKEGPGKKQPEAQMKTDELGQRINLSVDRMDKFYAELLQAR